MTSVTQTEAFAKLDEGTLKDFISKVGYIVYNFHEERTYKTQLLFSGCTGWSL